MSYSNTYDEKIMNFSGECYGDLVAGFTADEVAEMEHYLAHEYGWDFSYLEESERAECIVIEYVREWLIEQIRNYTIYGTEHLFRLVYMNA